MVLRRLLDRVPCEIGKDKSTRVSYGFKGSHARNLADDTTPNGYKITSGQFTRLLANGLAP
jgi:hypothetical protein